MDLAELVAVYIDDRVGEERWVSKDDILPSGETTHASDVLSILGGSDELRSSIELLVRAFKKVYLCNSGKSFANKLAELSEEADASCVPAFGFVDIDYTGDYQSLRRRSTAQSVPLDAPSDPAPPRNLTFSSQSEELFGLHLLSRFSADISFREEPNVIVPVAILRSVEDHGDDKQKIHGDEEKNVPNRNPTVIVEPPMEKNQIHCCLDGGAVDVLTPPLDEPTLHRLAVHAYRTQKAAQKERARFPRNRKTRKRSWVGDPDERPYAYLREAMVSKLMRRICNPEESVGDFPACEVIVPESRKRQIESQVADWHFSAHDFTDEELVFAASSMIAHALQLPELERFRLSPDELQAFVLSTRGAYNSFVLYHNFRHAVDVLQSTFHFLVRMGVLPNYPSNNTVTAARSEVASILTPFDALALLITAIGHDVGHPGVNNLFLVRLNAPLAQLYNDKSVLEAFHCAAFSQILRSHWPPAFHDSKLRALMINSILATDMGLHNQFVEAMGKLRDEYYANRGGGERWKPQDPEGCRTLLCALLIKCADIGNVARHWNAAEKWADILQLEFANQGDMEKEIGMETALFGGPPDLEDLVKKANSQTGFMQIFALPLFDGVTELVPEMAFAANEIKLNRIAWNRLVDREKAKELPLEIRPTEKEIAEREKSEEFYTMQSSNPPPESWKEPPPMPQYDGFDQGCSEAQGSMPSQPQSDTSADIHSKGGSQECTPVINTPSSPYFDGRQGEPRRCMGHLQFQRSSGRSSVTTATNNRQNDASNGGRTQSTSTYTNNTIMTPISSTTQASSVISADSSYDPEHEGATTKGTGYDSARSSGIARRDMNRNLSPYDSNGHHRHQDTKPATDFVSDLLDQRLGDTQSNGIALQDPASVRSSDTQVHPKSAPATPPTSHAASQTSNTTLGSSGRSLGRRRSRLRLAFWKRSKPPPISPPRAPHNES